MLHKFSLHLFLAAIFSITTLVTMSEASILVNAPPPYPQSTLGTTSSFSIYYAGNTSGIPTSGVVNTAQGFRFIQTLTGNNTLPQNLLYLDVTTDQTFTIPGGSQLEPR